MFDDLLIFLAGGLFSGFVIFLLLRLRRAQKNKRASTSVSAARHTEPKMDGDLVSTIEDEPARLSDLHAQHLEAAARIREQRAASRVAREAKRVADEEEARRKAERLAAEDVIRRDALRIAAEKAIRLEVQRLAAAEEAVRLEALRIATEEKVAREAQRVVAVEAARREVQRIAAEEKTRQDAQRGAAAAEAARKAQQAIAAEENRRTVESAAKPVTPKQPSEAIVMIVDDSKVGRIKTNRFLINNQFQSQMAEDGCDALEKINAHMPDIVITDVEMPNMDGFELTKQIRSNPVTAHIPVIVISGNSDGYEDKAKEVGADLVLGKPYSEENMLAQVLHFLHNGRSSIAY